MNQAIVPQNLNVSSLKGNYRDQPQKNWLDKISLFSLGLILFLFVKSGHVIALPADLSFEQQVLDIIRNHPEVLVETLKRYQDLQAQQSQAVLLDQIFANRASVIGTSPVRGNIDSPIILLEFSDFQCPFCGASQPVLKSFLANYPDVSLVYKHFPLTSIHPQALAAARSSWAAHQQGQFWEYQDELFANADRLSEDFYLKLAQSLGLDLNQFNLDRNSEESLMNLQADVNLGQKLGLQGTPLFVFYNFRTNKGKYLYGVRDVNDFAAALAGVN